MDRTIKCEQYDQVVVLTINRPHKGNSLNIQVFNELTGQLKELEADRTIRVMVITGAGSKFFLRRT